MEVKNRIGSKPVLRTSSVQLDYRKNSLKVKGPKGELDINIPQRFDLKIDESSISVVPIVMGTIKKKEIKDLQGTLRQIIFNMVEGVSNGFEKVLLLKGIGYKAQVEGEKLILNLGYSLPIEYAISKKVQVTVDKNVKIVLSSCDKQELGQVAAEIRSLRPPEPYKGKGVHYEGEQIVRKMGKTGKKE